MFHSFSHLLQLSFLIIYHGMEEICAAHNVLKHTENDCIRVPLSRFDSMYFSTHSAVGPGKTGRRGLC